MKKKALIVVNLAGFLHFLWNDIATLQEMGYEVSVAMNENSAAGPNLIEIPKLEWGLHIIRWNLIPKARYQLKIFRLINN